MKTPNEFLADLLSLPVTGVVFLGAYDGRFVFRALDPTGTETALVVAGPHTDNGGWGAEVLEPRIGLTLPAYEIDSPLEIITGCMIKAGYEEDAHEVTATTWAGVSHTGRMVFYIATKDISPEAEFFYLHIADNGELKGDY